MTHPFQDKLFVFIGTPIRCTRQAARDALIAVGGVVDERLSVFAHYAVAFNGAERTKVYQKVLERDRLGSIILLTEQQFFDILDGKAAPPEKKTPPRKNGVIFIPANDPDAEERDFEKARQHFIERKRLDSIARYGVPMPDGGRATIDLRPLDMARRVSEIMKAESMQEHIANEIDRCDKCGKPAIVHIGDGHGGELAKLCVDCHNSAMAEMTEFELPDNVPKRLSFKGCDGKAHDFEIEFMMFPSCKTLTATEIGKSKYKAEVFGELEDNFDEMLKTLTSRIERLLSVKHIKSNGFFDGDKAVGYIEYNDKRDACDIIIDGKAYTWSELEQNINAREGWGIKIEFGDAGDEFDGDN